MDQYVIKTGSTARGKHYLSHHFFSYLFAEKASIYDSLKEVNKAMSWAKKQIAANIKFFKSEIAHHKKEVAKGNLSIHDVLLKQSKQSLKDWEKMKLNVVKL